MKPRVKRVEVGGVTWSLCLPWSPGTVWGNSGSQCRGDRGFLMFFGREQGWPSGWERPGGRFRGYQGSACSRGDRKGQARKSRS